MCRHEQREWKKPWAEGELCSFNIDEWDECCMPAERASSCPPVPIDAAQNWME
jgi:hypothetical protein